MQPALMALLYAPDIGLWSDVVSGKVTATVREGHRDYRPGPVMLCCHLASACVMAEIAEVVHTTLGQVPDMKRRRSGYATETAMIDGLRRFYPLIGALSPVTVITYAKVSGTLVDTQMVVMAPAHRSDGPTVARLGRAP